jgi:hypothetical protein
MDSSNVAVATLTWARSAEEAELIERSLDALQRLGVHVTVADRGNDPAFLDRLRARPDTTVLVARQSGLVPQVQESLVHAARRGTRFVLYTEPDKRLFFGSGLRQFLEQAPDEDDVGVVLAARSPESMATFPPMQRYTEGVVNDLCSALIGVAADYCYGPFLMHRALLAQAASIQPQLGWGWRTSTFVAARRHDLRVVPLTENRPCPPEQREEDEGERIHRLRQLSENVLGLIDGTASVGASSPLPLHRP